MNCGFAECLYRGLSLFFKAQCLPQIQAGLCLAGCHVVAQTQGLVKFQGGGVVLKFDEFPHCYAVFCAVCMQTMTHSRFVANVPSKQEVKLVM